MSETETKLVMEKLKHIDATLKDHTELFKELNRTMMSVALQKQKIENLDVQMIEIWKRLDIIRDFQAGCPRDTITSIKEDADKNYKKLWSVIALLSLFIAGMGFVKNFL